MLILNEVDIVKVGIDWRKNASVIEKAIGCLLSNDYAQPLKPYLRYRNLRNRIIAMPAFVGGDINVAGIKWISSFPGNIENGISRAHCVVLLNNADTGEPEALINTPLISIIRTVSVSAMLLQRVHSARRFKDVKIGIIGFGPIGQYHLKMCRSILGDNISRIALFDIRSIDSTLVDIDERVKLVSSWEDAYVDADIVITCTVSDKPYINKEPKRGSLHLNVSLRDYNPEAVDWFKDAIIVDDWEEVCREKTDIEVMHLEKGLRKIDTKSLAEIVQEDWLNQCPVELPIMFNPMGMAVFDIAISDFYCRTAKTIDEMTIYKVEASA